MHLAHLADTSLGDAALGALSAGGRLGGRSGARRPAGPAARGGAGPRFPGRSSGARCCRPWRSLQFGGEGDPEASTPASHNCGLHQIDRLEAFRETLISVALRLGVGFSVQRAHVAKLPPLAPLRFQRGVTTHVVADTIEGWADALQPVMLAAVEGRRGVLSTLRASARRGAAAAHVGGQGARPRAGCSLATRIEHIVQRGRRTAGCTSIEAYDILMWAAKRSFGGACGARRRFCLFSADDEEMAAARPATGSRTTPSAPRATIRHHIRAEATPRPVRPACRGAEAVWAEPGFYFVEDPEYGAIRAWRSGLAPALKLAPRPIARAARTRHTGELHEGDVLSGVQFCNLTTVRRRVRTPARFYRLCAHAPVSHARRRATRISPIFRRVTAHHGAEALLGVSICGVPRTAGVLLDPEVLRNRRRRWSRP